MSFISAQYLPHNKELSYQTGGSRNPRLYPQREPEAVAFPNQLTQLVEAVVLGCHLTWISSLGSVEAVLVLPTSVLESGIAMSD